MHETGDFLEGFWKDDKLNGKCRIIYCDSGAVYQGQALEGLPHGQGHWTKSADEYYKGGYEQGEKHGFGEEKHVDYTYNGAFSQGKRHG